MLDIVNRISLNWVSPGTLISSERQTMSYASAQTLVLQTDVAHDPKVCVLNMIPGSTGGRREAGGSAGGWVWWEVLGSLET